MQDNTINNGLLIVNDEETIFQFLMVKKEFPEIKTWDAMVNGECNGYPSIFRVQDACKKCPSLGRRIPFYERKLGSYSVVVVVPGYRKEVENLLTKRIEHWDTLVLLDKGIEEFESDSFVHTELNKQAIKYSFNTDRLANSNYKEIRQFKITSDVQTEFDKQFESEIDAIKDSNADILMYSSAKIYDMDEDVFNKINTFLSDQYTGKKVAIKRHPLDNVVYNPDHVTIKYVPDELPRSILVEKSKTPSLWVFPSSLLLKGTQAASNAVMWFKHITDPDYISLMNSVKKQGYEIVYV